MPLQNHKTYVTKFQIKYKLFIKLEEYISCYCQLTILLRFYEELRAGMLYTCIHRTLLIIMQ